MPNISKHEIVSNKLLDNGYIKHRNRWSKFCHDRTEIVIYIHGNTIIRVTRCAQLREGYETIEMSVDEFLSKGVV